MSPATDSDRLNLGGVGVLDERRGRPEGLRSISTLYLDCRPSCCWTPLHPRTVPRPCKPCCRHLGRRTKGGASPAPCRFVSNQHCGKPPLPKLLGLRPTNGSGYRQRARGGSSSARGGKLPRLGAGRQTAIASRAREMVPLRACVFQGSSVLSRSFSCQVLGSGLCARLTRSSSSLRHCSPPGPSRRHRLSMRPRSPSSTALHCRWAVHCLQVMARARAPAPGLGIS